MYSALTPLAQKVKLAVETDDKETWQGLTERNKEKKIKLNNTDHRKES